MRCGEIWTVAGGRAYADKPRPALIVQDERFDAAQSITICILTTNPTEAPLFRPVVEPNAGNGQHATSRLMVDNITTIPKSRLGMLIGVLDQREMERLNQAMLVFLGVTA